MWHKNNYLINALLLFIAFIWGVGFVFQKEGMMFMGPIMFNAWRFFLGALTLLPMVLLAYKKSSRKPHYMSGVVIKKGVILGGLLFAGASFQQIGIQYTSLANVAFITSLYVILVPILGYFIGYRYRLIVWLAAIMAIIGLYGLTGGSTQLQFKGDLFALIGAFFWAVHLLLLAKISPKHPPLLLSWYQFVFCTILSLIGAILFEQFIIPTQGIAYIWLALSGVLVVGVAYTLQVIVMEYADPFAASMIFILEAVFGAIAGYLIYNERLDTLALCGASLLLLSSIIVQLPGMKKTKIEKINT